MAIDGVLVHERRKHAVQLLLVLPVPVACTLVNPTDMKTVTNGVLSATRAARAARWRPMSSVYHASVALTRACSMHSAHSPQLTGRPETQRTTNNSAADMLPGETHPDKVTANLNQAFRERGFSADLSVYCHDKVY